MAESSSARSNDLFSRVPALVPTSDYSEWHEAVVVAVAGTYPILANTVRTKQLSVFPSYEIRYPAASTTAATTPSSLTTAGTSAAAAPAAGQTRVIAGALTASGIASSSIPRPVIAMPVPADINAPSELEKILIDNWKDEKRMNDRAFHEYGMNLVGASNNVVARIGAVMLARCRENSAWSLAYASSNIVQILEIAKSTRETHGLGASETGTRLLDHLLTLRIKEGEDISIFCKRFQVALDSCVANAIVLTPHQCVTYFLRSLAGRVYGLEIESLKKRGAVPANIADAMQWSVRYTATMREIIEERRGREAETGASAATSVANVATGSHKGRRHNAKARAAGENRLSDEEWRKLSKQQQSKIISDREKAKASQGRSRDDSEGSQPPSQRGSTVGQNAGAGQSARGGRLQSQSRISSSRQWPDGVECFSRANDGREL